MAFLRETFIHFGWYEGGDEGGRWNLTVDPRGRYARRARERMFEYGSQGTPVTILRLNTVELAAEYLPTGQAVFERGLLISGWDL